MAALWALLRWYIDPEEPPHRKDLVLAWAAIVAGVAGIGTLYVGWRNMRTTQDNLRIAQQNTERTLLNTREVEEERAKEQALQSYLENIGELLAAGKLRTETLRQRIEVGSERHEAEKQALEDARTVARAQTLAVLQGMDPKRKRIILQFLYEARLIPINRTVVRLAGADLRRADLRGAILEGVDLAGVDLGGARLTGANLVRSDLGGANLTDADLRRADLQEAVLTVAELTVANLREAYLAGANL